MQLVIRTPIIRISDNPYKMSRSREYLISRLCSGYKSVTGDRVYSFIALLSVKRMQSVRLVTVAHFQQRGNNFKIKERERKKELTITIDHYLNKLYLHELNIFDEPCALPVHVCKFISFCNYVTIP